MTVTLLIDLDDTLIDSNFEEFLPAYFRSLASYLAYKVPADVLLPALMTGTQKMIQNTDPACTLKEVFDKNFYPLLGLKPEELEQGIAEFYDQQFPLLGKLTKPRADAQDFISWATSQGYRIAVATDPLFPRIATNHRLRWAGFEPESFLLISSFEKFHFSKNNPAYYAEMLGQIGWPDDPIVMIGNDFDRDISPAQKVGFATFEISPDTHSGEDRLSRNSKGDFGGLNRWLQLADTETFAPDFHSREAQLALMAATPASLDALLRSLDDENCTIKTSPDAWSMIEIVCHLRDSENELNQMQIGLFGNGKEPFIPRPDAAVWARQRNYLDEDPGKAMVEFINARKETSDLLINLPAENWSLPARHSIFGPTNFLEVIGFMTEHDRLHIQQVWKTLRDLPGSV